MKTCSLCGNPYPENSSVCPYCNTQQSGSVHTEKSVQIKTINLESGKPTVEEALSKLDRELNFVRSGGIKLVRIIHGFGSSGVGGNIKTACHRRFRQFLTDNRIKAFIPGENYTVSNRQGLDLMNRYPVLKKTERTDRENRGITFIEL